MLTTGGIVLCGGQSKRMGQPKAWLPFAGELMLQRVVRLVGEAVRPVVVVAAPGQELPSLPPEVPIVRDETQGRGPLQGLAAGLKALESQVDAAYVSSCDVPLLRPAFIRRVIDQLCDYQICVPHIDDKYHPLAAVYRVTVLPAVQELLAADRLRPFFLFDSVPTRFANAEELVDIDPALESLENLNTPADYEKAISLASSPRRHRPPPQSHDLR